MRAPRSTRLAAVLVTAALALTACGTDGADDATTGDTDPAANPADGDDEAGDPTAHDDGAATDADGADAGDAAGDDAAASFPVEIEHAFGSTEITEEPARVVTWGWGSTEAAIAVGVYPVAMTEQVWTVGEGGQLPWIEEAVEDAGEESPTLLTDDFTAPPYEEIIAQEPDLIVAAYSGITEEQYELLSEIAPTVAYPEGPWATPWRDVIDITARALGREEAGQQVLADIDAFFSEQAEAHPEFAGQTVANVWDGDGQMSVYTSLDPRAAMLTELGFEIAPAVDELDTDTTETNFYYDLSYEQLDRLESDVVVSYHSTPDEADAFLTKADVQAIPAVAEGNVAQVVGNEYVSSVSPPTALSVYWGMPDLIESLSAALD
ncbi:iron-siderophore ABC transporter substrate-binding protein [Egicoccus halophilus]|uniref:ABC transporter substrate-binding protein n=1 Tax=Egicoccus halophilus TaxID=1670830 RepID=A0A8J3ACP6_9ACTN|nr:iron-siderophore ABC transporter substrate-binding protein [Egicoccus halophilus]GGI08671.1 ABC transporter substrate-binding protein [Egicoccus halophilus]